MCRLCLEMERRHPDYILCPYCGKRFKNFTPNYITEITGGLSNGLPTLTSTKLKPEEK